MMAFLSVAYELHDLLPVLYLDSTLSCIQWHDLMVFVVSIVFHFHIAGLALSLFSSLLLCLQSTVAAVFFIHPVKHIRASVRHPSQLSSSAVLRRLH
jgi:hypothetical protein